MVLGPEEQFVGTLGGLLPSLSCNFMGGQAVLSP